MQEEEIYFKIEEQVWRDYSMHRTIPDLAVLVYRGEQVGNHVAALLALCKFLSED